LLQKKKTLSSVLGQDSEGFKEASVKPACSAVANKWIFQMSECSLEVHSINISLMTRWLCWCQGFLSQPAWLIFLSFLNISEPDAAKCPHRGVWLFLTTPPSPATPFQLIHIMAPEMRFVESQKAKLWKPPEVTDLTCANLASRRSRRVWKLSAR